jgi:RNA polymerase sigma-70 factor (ECF subfamily)
MRRYNQRLYRTARAIVRDDSEAEDVMQDAYVNAYEHLAQFKGHARFSTWLTRIAVHEALARVRRRQRFVELEEGAPALASPARGPEQRVADGELARVLEVAVDELPDHRCAFTGGQG